MDDRTTADAPAPNQSAPLTRRVAAGLIDLTFVCLAGAVAAAVASTRVPAIRQPDGSVTFSDTDRSLLNGLTGPLSGGRLLGDTLWAFSTLDVVVVVAAALTAAATLGVLVPRLTGGRSPGKLLLRLQVTMVDGRPAGIFRHLVRTLAAPVDLMPLVVPGLTGFAFAASNAARQRIGDRLAGTIVVDWASTDDMIPVAEALAPRGRSRETRPGRPVPTIRSATLVVDAPARTDTSLNRRPLRPDLKGDRVAKPYPAPVRAGSTPVVRNHDLPEPQHHGETVDMNDRDSASEQGTTEATAERTALSVPVEERTNNPYPKPVRRSREVPEDTRLPDFDSLTLPESSLSDMPLTKDALFEALGLIPPGKAKDEATEERPVPAALAPKPQPAPSVGASDKPTQTAIAPMAAPTSTAAPMAAPTSTVAPMAAPTSTAAPTTTDAATTAAAPTSTEARTSAPAPTSTAALATATTARRGSSPAPNKRAPIWSEDWDAWIYWDTTLRTWFRHDIAHGTWVPMDED